jgi:hypothetical protein
VPVNEGQLVAYVGWLAIEREAGRRSVSAASLPQYISAVRVVAKSFFDGQEALTAGRMPILQALLRAYGQWEARSFPRLTHRGGVPADIIQAIWANAMQSEERVVIRDAAAVILAYVLGLRESSVMSLPAENITHTAAKMTVRLVLVKGKALRHAGLATYARLFGLPGDVNDWQPGSLSNALQRSFACSGALSTARHDMDISLFANWSSHGTDAIGAPCGGAQGSIWLGPRQR